jgi:hypothetical protein
MGAFQARFWPAGDHAAGRFFRAGPIAERAPPVQPIAGEEGRRQAHPKEYALHRRLHSISIARLYRYRPALADDFPGQVLRVRGR